MMDEMAQPQAVQTANQPGSPGSGAYWGDKENSAAASGSAAQAKTPDAIHSARGEAAAPFLTVRYNKQDKPLSREEAAVYAQKGMNYDKLSEKLKAADEQLKTMSGIKALAAEYMQRSGVTEAEALSTLQSKLSGSDMQRIVNAQLDAFMAAHPDTDPAKLPEAVLREWKRGVPLSEAYYAYQSKALDMKLREMERIAKAKAANEGNAAASMGGAGSVGAAHAQPLTDETIQAMSPAELEKNHVRIWAYLTGQKS